MTVRYRSLKISHPNHDYSASDGADCTNGYPILEKFRKEFDDVATKWRVSPLPAFDLNGKNISIYALEAFLKESLVLVHFELKHCLRDDNTPYAHIATRHIFTATPTNITVLAYDAERRPPLYKCPTLKPPTPPQTPPPLRLRTAPTTKSHAC
jgi:hypothetical protein